MIYVSKKEFDVLRSDPDFHMHKRIENCGYFLIKTKHSEHKLWYAAETPLKTIKDGPF